MSRENLFIIILLPIIIPLALILGIFGFLINIILEERSVEL
jgi:hypothetical protein